MTFAEMKQELSDRGFANQVTPTRLGYLINRARARLDAMYLWPYREDSAQGTAPLSIPTLGRVQAVTNETQGYVLEESSYDDILDIVGTDLTGTGSPALWYLSTPAGTPVVNTYPVGSDTIGVQFFKTTSDLSADGDVPACPSRYALLIVDLAQQQAERDRSNYGAAQAIQVDIDRQIQEMVLDLLPQQSARFTKVTGSSVDW